MTEQQKRWSRSRTILTLIGLGLLTFSLIQVVKTIKFIDSAKLAVGSLTEVNEKGRRGKLYYRISFNPAIPRGPEFETFRRINIEREGHASMREEFIFRSYNPLVGMLFEGSAPVIYNSVDPNEASVNTVTSLYGYAITSSIVGAALIVWSVRGKRKSRVKKLRVGTTR
jgi:hypothetical protein